MTKYAILSMDVEDWYHLDYFNKSVCDKTYSLLDGLNVYQEFLEQHSIQSSFFFLSDTVTSLRTSISDLLKSDHDIGSHGTNHIRPLLISPSQFREDLRKSKNIISQIIGKNVEGYRAPCFNLDRERLDIVIDEGFSYDSSKINFSYHPLYHNLDLAGFERIDDSISINKQFVEFEVSTITRFNKTMPISGGGYLRILPWWLTEKFLIEFLQKSSIYIFYIHPFELSKKSAPSMPDNTSQLTKFRFIYGRTSMLMKLNKLVTILKESGFEFTTFSRLRKNILDGSQ